MGTPVRLQRYLAAAGVAARRKAEDLITAGRVKVNGQVVRVLGTKVDPDRDQVEVDGEAVVAHDKFYVLFNKPKGCITSVTDDRGRTTVMDYLVNLPVPVKPVGRLDYYSEGVLLLTNDGELAARLLAPASHVPKTYHVKVHGQLSPEHVRQLRSGVRLDDGTVTLPADVEILPGESKHTWLGITIHEGKHRQIHRMIESLGFRVDKLQRVAFANLTFHDLRVGDARELTQAELNELRDSVGLDHSTVARGAWHASREDTDIPRRAREKARAEREALERGDPHGDAPYASASPGGFARHDDAPDETDLDMIEDEDAQREEAETTGPTSRFVRGTARDAGRTSRADDGRNPRAREAGRTSRADDGRNARNGDRGSYGTDKRTSYGPRTKGGGGSRTSYGTRSRGGDGDRGTPTRSGDGNRTSFGTRTQGGGGDRTSFGTRNAGGGDSNRTSSGTRKGGDGNRTSFGTRNAGGGDKRRGQGGGQRGTGKAGAGGGGGKRPPRRGNRR